MSCGFRSSRLASRIAISSYSPNARRRSPARQLCFADADAQNIRMPGEIARSRAVTDLLSRHRRPRAEAESQHFHDSRAGRRDQLFLNFAGVDRRALQQLQRRRRRNRHHAVRAALRCRRRHSAASRRTGRLPALRRRRQRRRCRRWRRPRRLRENECLRVDVVDLGFRRAQRKKYLAGSLLRALADRSRGDDLQNVAEACAPCA